MDTGKSKKPFDFERFKEEAMEGLYQGKKIGGTDGVFAPMLKHLLESMLAGELDTHLEESRSSGENNRKNGKTKKTVRSLQSGHFELESTRDRNGTTFSEAIMKQGVCELYITANKVSITLYYSTQHSSKAALLNDTYCSR